MSCAWKGFRKKGKFSSQSNYNQRLHKAKCTHQIVAQLDERPGIAGVFDHPLPPLRSRRRHHQRRFKLKHAYTLLKFQFSTLQRSNNFDCRN